MPELPEVETTRRGLKPHLLEQTVKHAVIRQPKLRWPIAADLTTQITGQTVRALHRRSKYLLIQLDSIWLIWHLGMSGSLRLTNHQSPAEKHDHVDIELTNGNILRYRDPRRFGALLLSDNPYQHPLLSRLGPEPLETEFTAEWLYQRSRNRRIAVKAFIMDAQHVVGVGNIYATESLFQAGIHPSRAAGRISLARYKKLVTCIKEVLAFAIEQGGTSLKDFVNSDGQPGYFAIELQVYGRSGKTCFHCQSELKNITIAQRTSVFCPSCQT
ncbi:MAG: bifunctional DNA-formamidopyrimidine glycosylase/DNA-(apurinic or apyrimidinic site) lyase [bacterium]